jgi:uncharacterized protein (TIGR04255 family)
MAPLPSFDAPPVTEVVIGTRFRPSAAYSVLAVAALAQELGADGFPRLEEKAGYEAPTEAFGPGASVQKVSLELLSGPPPTRYWLLNEVGDELLQIQPNWLAANWRKVAPEAEYGRWGSRWDAFASWLGRVEGLLTSAGGLHHEQVEVTYINHIERAGVWETHADAASVFSFVTPIAGKFLPAAERMASDAAFVIADREGAPLGRLHATATPAFKRPTGEPIFVLNLTARGKPPTPDVAGVRAFAELGHEWIVRGFADLTTPEMQTAWQRTN